MAKQPTGNFNCMTFGLTDIIKTLFNYFAVISQWHLNQSGQYRCLTRHSTDNFLLK